MSFSTCSRPHTKKSGEKSLQLPYHMGMVPSMLWYICHSGGTDPGVTGCVPHCASSSSVDYMDTDAVCMGHILHCVGSDQVCSSGVLC